MLLIFAHYKEAETFFENISFEKVNKLQQKIQLYVTKNLVDNKELFLLICGEGKEKALFSTTLALSFLQNQVATIINYGVAGALNDSLNQSMVFDISTVYMQQDSQMQFISFPTSKTRTTEYSKAKNKVYDLITSNDRIYADSAVSRLKCFADLVDREAWAIAYCAHQFKKKLYVFKTISDISSGEQGDFCKRVLGESKKFSDVLFAHFQKNETDNFQAIKNLTSVSSRLISELNTNFYLSFSQKKFLEKHLATLSKHDLECITNYYNRLLLNSDLSKKDKTKQLILQVEKIIKPLSYELKLKLNFLFSNFQNDKIKIQYDQKLEDQILNIKLKIRSQEDLDLVVEKLKNIPFAKFSNLFTGKF